MIDPQTYSAEAQKTVYAGDARMAGAMPNISKQSSDAQAFSTLVRNVQGDGTGSGTSRSGSSSGAGQAGTATKKSGGFMDFLTTLFDIINPLEHIPIISTIYEHVTGHHMNPIARIAGDTLYGGPIGTAIGVANVVAEKQTGKDIGENMLAMVTEKGGKSPGSAPSTAVAQNGVTWDQPGISSRQVHWDTPASSVAGLPAAAPAPGSVPSTFVDADVNTSKNMASLQGAGPAAPAIAPRGQVAQQMMAGLDKYAALQKQRQPAASFSAAF